MKTPTPSRFIGTSLVRAVQRNRGGASEPFRIRKASFLVSVPGASSLPTTMLALHTSNAIILAVNGSHRKTLEKVRTDPVNGNIEWSRIESLLKAAGCRVVEGAGSSVTFEFSGRKMTLHRPHPGKAALRYRVLAVREFIERMGIGP